MSAHEPRYSDHHAPPRYIDSAAAGPARKTARVARRWRICERRIESYVARNSHHIARRSAQHLIFRVIQPTRPTPWRAALASVPGCGVRDAFRTTNRQAFHDAPTRARSKYRGHRAATQCPMIMRTGLYAQSILTLVVKINARGHGDAWYRRPCRHITFLS